MWIRIIIFNTIFKVLLSMSTGHPKTWDDFEAQNKVRLSCLKSTSWHGLPAVHRALSIWKTVKACKYLPRSCTGLTGIAQASNGPHWMGWCYPQHCSDSYLWDRSAQVQHRRGETDWAIGNKSPSALHCKVTGCLSQYSQSTNEGIWPLCTTVLQWLGVHVQWRRVAAMHRIHSLGILSRLTGMGCIVCPTYSVSRSLSLWHCDTNHRLIRFVLLKRLLRVPIRSATHCFPCQKMLPHINIWVVIQLKH